MTERHWSSDRDDDDIVWLKIDKHDSDNNFLAAEVLMELNDRLAELEASAPRGVVIYSGKERAFIMGADIKEFTQIETPEQGYGLVRQAHSVFDRLESLPCPTVVAINGVCLGGGLELAMACDYRIAFDTDKKILGLPEVQLGINPGFGGTVRSVRLVGVRPAMQMMLTGAPMAPPKAKKIGLIDRITSDETWRADAKKLIEAQPPRQRAPFVERLLSSSVARPFIRNVLLKQVRSKARKEHYPAPYAIVDLWSRFGAKGDVAFEAEAQTISKLMCGETSRNLVRVFFLQTRLKSQGKKDTGRIEHVHVVGAGVMGGDIAAWCALRGNTVTLQDREMQYIEPALERAKKLFARRVRDEAKRAETAARLRPDVAGDGAAEADLVIEAIFENLEAKQALYKDLQAKMKPSAMLATNTSSIRLEDLRTVLDEPQRFIGLHFFNPVAMLPLVEVIRCEDTEREALDSGAGFVRSIGKLPLECSSAPGFVVNRILAPYTGEAMALAEEGVPLAEIDRAAEAFGMPMGPIELIDSVGLDVGLGVAKVMSAAFDRPIPGNLGKLVEDGRLGRKSGRGFYEWEDGKAVKPEPAGSVPDDLQDRLILPMLNEAVAALSEGVIDDADLLDAGVIFGTGFAPFRGGPLNYARARGIDEVVGRLADLAGRHGERFTPHEGWANLQ